MRFDGFEQRLEQMIDATATGYEAAVRSHMPDCLYRDFLLWGMSRQNPHQPAVMQLMGAVQLSKLTVRLLAGLTEREETWQRLLRTSMTMNGWALLEAISDNLAMGLARHLTGDSESDATRHALLHAFNTLMVERLKDEISAASARAALSNVCPGEVSLFRQHLSPLKFRSLAETFIHEKGGALSEIEYAACPHLIANIEAGADFINAIGVVSIRSLVRDSLIARYEGVNKLLEPDECSLEEIFDIGGHTILVIPTLGYYISELVQCIGMKPRLVQLIDEGTLAGALYAAAVLVRLQNDIGTQLLTFDAPARLKLLRELEERARERKDASLGELLAGIGREYAPLNRIWKDACLGEFNLCLSGIGQAPFSSGALLAFDQRLTLLAKVYAAHKVKLASGLWKINDGLKDNLVSQIVLRFVGFHERLYDGHYHDTIDGDYAIC
jgi:hypothetical protein